MGNFLDKLNQISDDNTLEKRIERAKVEQEAEQKRKQEELQCLIETLVDKLVSFIKEKCIESAEKGNKETRLYLYDCINKVASQEENVFFIVEQEGDIPPGNSTFGRHFIKCGEIIANMIYQQLMLGGITNIKIEIERKPIYKVTEIVREASKSEKAGGVFINLFFDKYRDANNVTEYLKETIGEQVYSIIFTISWKSENDEGYENFPKPIFHLETPNDGYVEYIDGSRKVLSGYLTSLDGADILPGRQKDFFGTYLEDFTVKSVFIPERVTKISKNTFYACRKLQKCIMPSSLVSIGGAAFEGCSSLTSIDIPELVRTVSYSCFAKCKNLSVVNFLGDINTIGDGAFAECPNLKKVFLPTGTEVYKNAFSDSITIIRR